MSWITIVWSMNAAACLTLAGIYLLVWCKQREGWAYLVLSCNAVAGAALTAFELALLRAQTSEQYAMVLRWAQAPVFVVVISLVVFVRLYLRAGRRWLAWSVCGVRTLALILNFIFVPNLSYREITSLRQVSWWGGETVSVPIGVTNPWILVAQLSLVLLVIFFVDATITAWRRGHRQRALVVGGALIFFSAIAIGEVVLVVWGIIQAPFLACFSYLGLIAAMGYQMSNDMLQRAQISLQLQREVAERARLEREVIEICAREQQRIAYDLHDGVGQQLVGVALNAKLLEQELRAARSAEAEKASEIVRLANQAARQARLTARNLEGADGVGDLKTALQTLVESVRRDCRIDGIVKADGDASSFPVGALVAAQLYRIAQEAVHNAVEHGGARKVEIDLARNHENFVLTVRDNGEGFDTSAISQGMGLRIMQYRVQSIGGSCEVQSNRNKGTIVTCRVPLRTEVAVRPIP
jgi:signal transduction histidine kinase